MERTRTSAGRVGIFVLIGLALLAGVVFTLTDWQAVRRGHTLQVEFDSASGLSAGAPVHYAGVAVGHVQDIRILRDETGATVRLTLWLPNDIQVQADDQIFIGLLGLLGEKYVAIKPGTGEGETLASGATIEGTRAISELEIARRLSRILTKAESVVQQANKLVSERALLDRLQAIADRTEQVADDLDETKKRADALMSQWERVGEQSSQVLKDLQRWGPLVTGAAILPLLGLLLLP